MVSFFFITFSTLIRSYTELVLGGGGWGKSSLAAIGNIKTKVEKQSSLTFFPSALPVITHRAQ